MTDYAHLPEITPELEQLLRDCIPCSYQVTPKDLKNTLYIAYNQRHLNLASFTERWRPLMQHLKGLDQPKETFYETLPHPRSCDRPRRRKARLVGA